jgi:ABC-2 type transport system permease protein
MSLLPPDIRALCWKHQKIMFNYLRGFREQPFLKVLVIAFFSVFFWFGLYGIFFAGFRFLHQFTDVLDLVISFTFSLFYLTLMSMLILSNGVLLYSSLYHSEEAAFLIHKPIRAGTLYLYHLVVSLFFSTWAFLFLGAPLMTAYGQVKGVHFYFYPLVLLFFLAFMFIPAALSSLMIAFVPFILPRLSFKHLVWGAAFLLIGAGLYFIPRIEKVSPDYTEKWLISMFETLSFTRNIYLPSYWVSRGTLSLANEEWEAVAYNFVLLISNSLFFILIAYYLYEILYFLGYQKISNTHTHKEYLFSKKLEKKFHQIPLLSMATRILILKDMKHFFRDPMQWSQFLVLFGILTFYILNLRNLAYDGQQFYWKNLIAFLNLGATTLCLATYASRFIYPLISLEGKRFWILGVSPLTRKKLVLSKFYFCFFSLLLISEFLVLTSCFMLKVPLLLVLIQACTCFFISLGLSGLTVGLSAIYINLKDTNPAKIVSGFGGTLNLVLALLYLFPIIVVQAFVSYTIHSPSSSQTLKALQTINPSYLVGGTLFLTLVFTLAFTAIPLFLGIRKFEKMQF